MAGIVNCSFHGETTGYDVERVLREQDTHDLFCPRCCSRITGKVIVRRRPNEPDGFRCLSCFTFFIPKGAPLIRNICYVRFGLLDG